jgi:hypothetical protein
MVGTTVRTPGALNRAVDTMVFTVSQTDMHQCQSKHKQDDGQCDLDFLGSGLLAVYGCSRGLWIRCIMFEKYTPSSQKRGIDG